MNIIPTGLKDTLSSFTDFVKHSKDWVVDGCYREVVYVTNWKTVAAGAFAVAGVVAGIAVIYFLGLPGAGFAVISLLIGVGIAFWLIRSGRRYEQGKVLAVHIKQIQVQLGELNNKGLEEKKIDEELKKVEAEKLINKDVNKNFDEEINKLNEKKKTNETEKTQTLVNSNRRLNLIKGSKDSHIEIKEIVDNGKEFLLHPSNGELKTLLQDNIDTFVWAHKFGSRHENIAKREWEKLIAGH